MIIVAKDSSGTHTSLQDAVNDAVPGDTIFIKNGIYTERVEIRTPQLTLCGESEDGTILTGARFALMPMPDIGKLGTFRTYTMLVDADNTVLRNFTVRNAAGCGPAIGQAIALYADGDRLLCENLRLLGCQDTLFTGPLPPQEIEKNGFIGPKQNSPRRPTHQVYRSCFIEGDIDFIFGSADALFTDCTLFQKHRPFLPPADTVSGNPVCSYAAAPSTPEGQHSGYVFDTCRFESDCPPHSCYLGRPWRNYAKLVILRSWLGAQICPEGFHNWNKPDAEKTVFFAEYKNSGPGADLQARPDWVHRLTDSEAAVFMTGKLF